MAGVHMETNLCKKYCNQSRLEKLFGKACVNMNVRDSAEQLKEQIVSWRRAVHAYPEIAWTETKTGNMVAAELEKMGMEVTRIADTGVVGILKGEKKGKTVALRADMDALAITEATDVPYKSK